jgi:hypothetical protein
MANGKYSLKVFEVSTIASATTAYILEIDTIHIIFNFATCSCLNYRLASEICKGHLLTQSTDQLINALNTIFTNGLNNIAITLLLCQKIACG